MRSIMLAAAVALSCARWAEAQRVEDGRAGVARDSLAPNRPGVAFLARTGLGTAGLVGGAFLGAYVGSGFGGGDYDGIGYGVLLGVAGAWVGVATGAMLPDFGSTCPEKARFWRGFAAAPLGLLVGSLASMPLKREPLVQGAVVVVTPALFAALALGDC